MGSLWLFWSPRGSCKSLERGSFPYAWKATWASFCSTMLPNPHLPIPYHLWLISMYENLKYYLILTIFYAVSGTFVVLKTQSSNKETKNYTSLWINGMKTQKRRQKIDHLEVWRSESWVKRDKNNPRTWITSKKCIIKTKLTNNVAGGTPASQTNYYCPHQKWTSKTNICISTRT